MTQTTNQNVAVTMLISIVTMGQCAKALIDYRKHWSRQIGGENGPSCQINALTAQGWKSVTPGIGGAAFSLVRHFCAGEEGLFLTLKRLSQRSIFEVL